MQLSVGNEIRLISQFNEQLDREPGTPLVLSVAPESIYLFDPATDESIDNRELPRSGRGVGGIENGCRSSL